MVLVLVKRQKLTVKQQIVSIMIIANAMLIQLMYVAVVQNMPKVPSVQHFVVNNGKENRRKAAE